MSRSTMRATDALELSKREGPQSACGSQTRALCGRGFAALRCIAELVSVYRGHCVSERSAAFTPLPLGTLSAELRTFLSGGKGAR